MWSAGFGRILNGEASVESGRALVEGPVSVPIVGAAPGGDDDRSCGGASGVGVFLRGADGEFLNGIRREILQKASNPVVGVVGTINGEFVVEAGTAAGGNGGDACFGGIRGLDGLRARDQICDVGEAARGERKSFEIAASHYSLMNCARNIHRFGGDGGDFPLNLDLLLNGGGLQGHNDVANCSDGNGDLRLCVGKAWRAYGEMVSAGKQVIKTEFAAIFAGGAAQYRRAGELSYDLR